MKNPAEAVQFYIDRSTPENTKLAFDYHIDHFRFTWKGDLPASSESICLYLAEHATVYKVSTLRQRLSALSSWHTRNHWPDPTKTEAVQATMTGIARTHQLPAKQAYPLTFRHLAVIVQRLEQEKAVAIQGNHTLDIRRIHRDLSLLLLGFWQGFRSDELTRINASHVTASHTNGLTIFLPHSKTDANAEGKTFTIPALPQLCPTVAYLNWLAVSGIVDGPVYRSINRWGQISDRGVSRQTVELILDRVSDGLFPDEPKFSAHSLRHGFADWAVTQGWELSALMNHVGWSSVKNATRYMPKTKDFSSLHAPLAELIVNDFSGAADGTTLIGSYSKI